MKYFQWLLCEMPLEIGLIQNKIGASCWGYQWKVWVGFIEIPVEYAKKNLRKVKSPEVDPGGSTSK